ncbi:hypothetical protein ACIHFE_06590 [Streptomyces sp. NPDC052396]|uniref:hypothetical protein n=1 Tax=Streptomyces sp. NPDC052396 TaxID=3365689 RepID=UPI0037D6581F
MQANDARMPVQCAVPTAAVGVVAIAVGFALAGGKGAIGSAVGLLLTLLVMGGGLLGLQRSAKQFPQLFQAMGLLLYMTQFLFVAVFLMVFKGTTLFNSKAFAFSLLAATLTWIAAQARAWMKAKIFYVDPQSADAKKPTPSGSPS